MGVGGGGGEVTSKERRREGRRKGACGRIGDITFEKRERFSQLPVGWNNAKLVNKKGGRSVHSRPFYWGKSGAKCKSGVTK